MDKISAFFGGKFMTDLKDGKLPEIEVKVRFDNRTILYTAAAVFIAGSLVMAMGQLIKRI